VNRLLSVISAFGAMVLGFGALPVMASTTTFNVPCGKIALLEQAVGTPGATVNLASGCTYHLTREFWSPTDLLNDDELPVVTGALTINGHGSVLQGIPTSSPACCGRILEVDGPGTLTVNSLTLSGGNASRGGGGLLVLGTATATLNGSIVKNSKVQSTSSISEFGTQGGGVLNGGTLRLNNSQVLNNVADSGGGIASSGTLSLTNNSHVSGNTASVEGGGIEASGVVAISNSSIIGNRVTGKAPGSGCGPGGACDWPYGPTGGGIYVSGTSYGSGTQFTLYKSVVASNRVSSPCIGCYASPRGGGIFIDNPYDMLSAVITESQISNNIVATPDPKSGPDGGGIFELGGSISVVGSTINYNGALNYGGGGAYHGGFDIDAYATMTTTTQTGNYCLSYGHQSLCPSYVF
jgi:predicted outer membrane repeat protein